MDEYQAFKSDYSIVNFLSANLSADLSATHARHSNFRSAELSAAHVLKMSADLSGAQILEMSAELSAAHFLVNALKVCMGQKFSKKLTHPNYYLLNYCRSQSFVQTLPLFVEQSNVLRRCLFDKQGVYEKVILQQLSRKNLLHKQ